jgi:hypothetical protein
MREDVMYVGTMKAVSLLLLAGTYAPSIDEKVQSMTPDGPTYACQIVEDGKKITGLCRNFIDANGNTFILQIDLLTNESRLLEVQSETAGTTQTSKPK